MDQLRATLQARLQDFPRLAATEEGLRHAAVALVVVLDERDQPGIVMTRRASRLGAHPGQYAFPGGRLDPGESAPDAARRELREEVALELAEYAVLGVLDDYVTRSGYVMTPVVLWGGPMGDGALVPAEAEVAYAFVVPLDDLDRAPNVYEIEESDRPVINVPFLDSVLHAPSGAIMHQFAEVALHGRVTRVANYDEPLFMREGGRPVES